MLRPRPSRSPMPSFVARVMGTFSRDDAARPDREGAVWAQLLHDNPSSARPKYTRFIALDMDRVKIIPDPGLLPPSIESWKRQGAAWTYPASVLLPWLNELGGLP